MPSPKGSKKFPSDSGRFIKIMKRVFRVMSTMDKKECVQKKKPEKNPSKNRSNLKDLA